MKNVKRKRNWKTLLAKRVRLARGILTQQDVGAASGIQENRISQIENCRSGYPKPKTIYRLAMATDEKPEEWFQLLGIPVTDKEMKLLKDNYCASTSKSRDWF